MPRIKILGAGVLAACLLSPAALAATPESGTISSTAPKAKWSGETTESAVAWYTYDLGSGVCEAPFCDTYTLNVAEAGDVLITIDVPAASNGASNAGLEVVDPSGKSTYQNGDAPFKHTIKKAAPGAYTLHITNSLIGTPVAYDGSAEYVTKAAPVGTPLVPVAAPVTPAGPPAPAALPTLEILTATGKAKAKSLAVKLRSSGALSNLVLTLKKGSKKVASTKLASLDGAGKAALKLKKLKKGAYKLQVSGTAADGRAVTASRSLKLK